MLQGVIESQENKNIVRLVYGISKQEHQSNSVQYWRAEANGLFSIIYTSIGILFLYDN